MKIDGIYTVRKIHAEVWYQLVYEWEDILSHAFAIPLIDDFFSENGIVEKISFRFGDRLSSAVRLFNTRKRVLQFQLCAGRWYGLDRHNILPCIIDFYIRGRSELAEWYKNFKCNPAVLITSREAYDYLKRENCPLRIFHWALSIPDDWINIDEDEKWEDRPYDIVCASRSNSVLLKFLDQYQAAFPDVKILRTIEEDGRRFFYCEKDGKKYNVDDHADYMSVLRMAKVGFYATPGLDNANRWSNGFNQVTPRFLEYVASGCNVVMRYPENSDVAFYDLQAFSPNIGDYGQFKVAVKDRTERAPDLSWYKEYLSRHVTSLRARQLADILKEI